MGELVDEQHGRFPRKRRVEIELRDATLTLLAFASRQLLQPLGQPLGLSAPVSLDEADHDIDALFARPPCCDQHRVRLAHAGRCPEEDLQPPTLAASFVRLDALQERIGVGTMSPAFSTVSASRRARD